MRRRQCAARSSVRIAKVRNPFNWSMADAWCSFLPLLTWYLYFPKKWHQCCYSTEFLVGTLVVVGEQKKSWINKNLCRNSTAGFRKWHNKSSPWNFAENEHEFIRNCHEGFNILWLVHENVFHSFHDNWAGVHRLKHDTATSHRQGYIYSLPSIFWNIMASCFREQCLFLWVLWTLLSWKCGYNPLKQGYIPYGPYTWL